MVNVSVAPVETLPAVSVAQTRNRAVVFEASESDAVSAVPVETTVPEEQLAGASVVDEVERTSL